MFITYLPIEFYFPGSYVSLVIAIRLKAKENSHMTVLLFYILQLITIIKDV
jgi:hypothetical protein